jgi:hypothetical protein
VEALGNQRERAGSEVMMQSWLQLLMPFALSGHCHLVTGLGLLQILLGAYKAPAWGKEPGTLPRPRPALMLRGHERPVWSMTFSSDS